MFIRYKCAGATCYFYDKNKQLIKYPLGEDNTSFIISKDDIEFFNFSSTANGYYNLNEYELNKNHYFANGAIVLNLSTILKKEEEIKYRYKNKNLFEYFEASNILPNENDSVFRENYFKDDNKKIYLSKYDPNYYPALSVSPPNCIFDEEAREYKYTNSGEASKLYRAFRNKNKIPKTLFLKPHCRQWNTGKVLLNEPGVYDCSYNYADRELTVGDKVYENVPHMITICCQGAGGGGVNGLPANASGHGGAAGGFIAVNCFLGNDVTSFKITVGKGGEPINEGEAYFPLGEPSTVEINQTIDLTNFENEKNPTFISHDGFKYTKLTSKLSFIAEGGGSYIDNNAKRVHKPGNGKIDATATGYYQNGDIIETDKNSNYVLSSLFFKILFNAKGGMGGSGIYASPDENEWKNAYGTGAYFTAIEDSTYWPNIKTTWFSDNYYELEKERHIYTRNILECPLILGGSTLKESLYSLTPYITPSLYPGGNPGSCDSTFKPGGGGGGSSLFGYGGMGGNSTSNFGKDGQLGAGGGGGQGGVNPGNGGNGGNGAVWLLW